MLKLKNNYTKILFFSIKKGEFVMRYLPFSKYKYYIKDKTEDLTTALEKEYQARLNGYTSQKTLLFPPPQLSRWDSNK